MPIEPTNDPFMDDKPELSKILELCILLSQPLDPDYLLEMLLETTQELTRADGATLYLMDSNPDQSRLFFEIVKNKTLQVSMGGSSETPCNFPPLALYNPQTKEPNFTNIATFVALHKTFVNIEDAYSQKEFDFAGTREMDRNMKYHSKSFLCFPVMDANGDVAAVIQLINAKNSTGETVAFSRMAEYITHALTSLASIAIDNSRLKKVQRTLTEAFITVTAKAIDTKSPYAGAHCQRVPIITNMLAAAATMADTGPLKDFEMTEDEWNCLHLASWLHDCGKVTTPEYVVDKATKLETLYDRIHEVRMRFEVLKRDAEIACLEAIAAGTPEAEAKTRLAAEWQALDADFAFVAACNEGGEFMAPERLARLRQIAGRTWRRTLDDRIGIAHEEKERKARTPAPPLPVAEPLLADRPDHRFERGPGDRMPPDNRWGFRMPVPELLYDKGELYNLSVARGTLSEEERYKINEHIVQTFIMLTALPFPKHLREVPEIASCHHEKMDGSGYPRRLVREQMGPVARMMAIADIFEALTAVDRPYKKGKTLTESLAIMARMRDEAHIDGELFDLFLRAGIWRDYAARFLRPEQIDAVDIAAYLAP